MERGSERTERVEDRKFSEEKEIRTVQMKSAGKSYSDILKGQCKGVDITKLSLGTLTISDGKEDKNIKRAIDVEWELSSAVGYTFYGYAL